MATNDIKDWSDLLDVALFEADRVGLRRRIEHATDAIHRRMEEILKDEHAGSTSERVALRNALTTLADLQRIAHGRKPSGRVSRESGRAISGQF
jgi:lactate dehydrogenase-like 2-hydroxyacid dehydrogenase